jgi:hypothetical protein
MDIPEQLQPFCNVFLNRLSAVLQSKLHGVYLHGAWVFPEAKAKGDVDLHVIVTAPLSDAEKSGITELHREVARRFPSLVGESPDIYYVLLDDARGNTPPTHQLSESLVDESWALHRAHFRAGRCIVLYGPDTRELFTEPSWAELDAALQSELHYVAEHLADYPAYCILNLCRLIYSYHTRDVVVSKHTSARWLSETYPEKSPCIYAAMRIHEGAAFEADGRFVGSEGFGFYNFACDCIAAIQG